MEALEGRKVAVAGLTVGGTAFYDFIGQLVYEEGGIPEERQESLTKLTRSIVERLQDTIGIIDFWKKPIEVKNLRGNIDTEMLLSGIPEVAAKHERLAVEVIKLAEKRHADLTK